MLAGRLSVWHFRALCFSHINTKLGTQHVQRVLQIVYSCTCWVESPLSGQDISFAFIVIAAFSTRETGQPFLALCAASSNL